MITALGVVGENAFRIAWVCLLSHRSLATLLSNITTSMENSFYRLKSFLCDCVYPKPSGLRNFPILYLTQHHCILGLPIYSKVALLRGVKKQKSGAKLA